MKKIIKLINHERSNTAVVSKKALYCDSDSFDMCSKDDVSGCTSYSYDNCGKDYTSCRQYAFDYCANLDDDRPCSGQGASDICNGFQDIT